MGRSEGCGFATAVAVALALLPPLGAVPPELPPITREDAARTTTIQVVQGPNGCDEFQGWIKFYSHYTQETPIGALDIVVMDDYGKNCTNQFNQEHPGFIRRIRDLTAPEMQVRNPPDTPPVAASSPGGRRLWPAQPVYFYVFWVVLEEILARGEHVLHIDLDVVMFEDLWSGMIKPRRAAVDMMAQCDCYGPGCKEFNCTFNSGTMFVRNTPAGRDMVTTIVNTFHESNWIDKATGQMVDKMKQISTVPGTHYFCDVFMLNKFLISRKCVKTETFEQKEGIFICGDLRVASLDVGFHHNRACGGGKSGITSPSEICRRNNVFIFHGHGKSLKVIHDEAPPLPPPPSAAAGAGRTQEGAALPPALPAGGAGEAAAAPPQASPASSEDRLAAAASLPSPQSTAEARASAAAATAVLEKAPTFLTPTSGGMGPACTEWFTAGVLFGVTISGSMVILCRLAGHKPRSAAK